MEQFHLLVVSPSFASCSEGLLDELEQAGVRVTHVRQKQKLGEDDYAGLIEDAQGLIVGADLVSDKVMSLAPRLKIISKHGVGLDNIDLEAAARRGIHVACAAGSNTVAVAELSCAMILALSRGLVVSTREIAAGQWVRRRGTELSGASLGVLGTGAIGKEVSKRMAAFGMRLLAYDPYPDPDFICGLGGRYVEIEELMRTCDFVTLHLPLTNDTRGMIGAEQLAWMKPGSFLVNAARGGIVDEMALHQALADGRLGGAGIDTFADEPPGQNPLTLLDNVVMTPHLGGYTTQAIDKMSRGAALNILEYLNRKRKEGNLNGKA